MYKLLSPVETRVRFPFFIGNGGASIIAASWKSSNSTSIAPKAPFAFFLAAYEKLRSSRGFLFVPFLVYPTSFTSFSVQRARTEFSGCTDSAILDLKTNTQDEKNRERPGTQGKLVESCTGCNKTTLDNASKYRVTPVRPTFRSNGAFFFNDLSLLSDGSLPSLYRIERTRYLYQRFEPV